MSNIKYHLAQFNITKLKADLDNPMMKEFRDFLAPVNLLAEESPGFVWRFKDENGDAAIEVETPFEDPSIFVNMSVWEDYESLRSYTYDTVHSYFLKSRKKWSEKMDSHQVVLWWVEKGQVPSLALAKNKLDQLEQQGSSPSAFSLRELYLADGTPTL
ncbi:protein of unknown function [Reichenbachiella faecimaris]|uniref:DUF3291 domain-containing protein n=1 Tax=Reichenbachiella faecimaris TaxID=692418 RepID=A0A1W2GBL2_REIFA|nr:DUF3291 domain-containing protein [Reichenbachiella faecimaris]SMD34069.1 protein of unknown function [Reichenbachiella faecimaris]